MTDAIPEVLSHPDAARTWSAARRNDGRRIVLVPTMGALHGGHQRLVEVAHEYGDAVVVSIFVNPLQFERSDDLDGYPHTFDHDLDLCASLGVTAVYAPTTTTMYPPDFQTRVEVGTLADHMEGEGRPGHFSGVTTVVSKLFLAVTPHVAVFGQKDIQQLVIVERITADLDFGVEIVRVPTVREADGVAMSSRNTRLGPEDREAARCIPAALEAVDQMVRVGDRSATSLVASATRVLLDEPRARVEYVEVADLATLQPIDGVDRLAVLCLAVWFGEVRLIDNLILSPSQPTP